MERYNLDAERALLGSILLNPDIFNHVREFISSDDMYARQHKIIFESLEDLTELGEPLNYPAVISFLEQHGRTGAIGGSEYLAKIAESVLTSQAYKTYVDQVKAAKNIDRLLILSDQIKDLVDSGISYHDIISELEDFVSNNNSSGGDTPLAQTVLKFAMDSNGPFMSTDVYNCLQLSTRKDKKNVSIILRRLRESGVIEKTGLRDGHYRKVDSDAEVMDFVNVSQEKIDLALPLGEHRWVTFMPKQLIVYAGSPDAGKTALLLNFIKLNQSRHKIIYMSSEMGPGELGGRLSLFDDIKLEEWKFKAIERSVNFSDVIDPDGINVIDFLEIGENFYQVGQMLTDIFRKLRKGIAVVALQKDPKKDVGKGGYMSMEKPRLYMTVDNAFPGHILKIVKAKNWRDPQMNPIGMSLKFKIVNGCKLLPQGTWEM